MDKAFIDDPKDRKRRFLRGLNRLLCHHNLEDQDIELKEIISVEDTDLILKLRNSLANVYCIEFTKDKLSELLNSGMTTRDFTEQYCSVVYEQRGNINLNALIGGSIKKINGGYAIDLTEMDKSPKYGLNGSQWCDVAEGPCSCGAWHH